MSETILKVANVSKRFGGLQALSDVQQQVGQMHVEVYRLMTIIGSVDEAKTTAVRKASTCSAAAARCASLVLASASTQSCLINPAKAACGSAPSVTSLGRVCPGRTSSAGWSGSATPPE